MHFVSEVVYRLIKKLEINIITTSSSGILKIRRDLNLLGRGLDKKKSAFRIEVFSYIELYLMFCL